MRQLILGKTIENFLEPEFGGKLGRYETGMLWRLSSLLKDLREMQAHWQKTAEREAAERKEALRKSA